jgi:hypothetical protein
MLLSRIHRLLTVRRWLLSPFFILIAGSVRLRGTTSRFRNKLFLPKSLTPPPGERNLDHRHPDGGPGGVLQGVSDQPTGGRAMKRLALAAVVVAFAGMAGAARAEDKADPKGTWKWTVNFGGNEREMTLKLKLDGDKLTGTLSRGDQESKIEDGKFKDGKVSFKVTRERDGNKFTITYSGKVSGDTIKGKSEFERDGETRTRDWEAKRAKS